MPILPSNHTHIHLPTNSSRLHAHSYTQPSTLPSSHTRLPSSLRHTSTLLHTVLTFLPLNISAFHIHAQGLHTVYAPQAIQCFCLCPHKLTYPDTSSCPIWKWMEGVEAEFWLL